MFSLARLQLPTPVTITIPARPGLSGGTAKTISGFSICFRINPVTKTIHAELPPVPRPLLIYGAQDFAAVAADTPEQHVERVLQILGSDPAEVLQALCDDTALPPMPVRVPREIANWRAKAVLGTMGLTGQVEAAIAALTEPQRTVVTAAWAGDAAFARKGATVTALAAALGLTADQLDQLFIQAAALEV